MSALLRLPPALRCSILSRCFLSRPVPGVNATASHIQDRPLPHSYAHHRLHSFKDPLSRTTRSYATVQDLPHTPQSTAQSHQKEQFEPGEVRSETGGGEETEQRLQRAEIRRLEQQRQRRRRRRAALRRQSKDSTPASPQLIQKQEGIEQDHGEDPRAKVMKKEDVTFTWFEANIRNCPMIDAEYYRATLPLPEKEQYPRALASLFQHRYPNQSEVQPVSNAITHAYQLHGIDFRVEAHFTSRPVSTLPPNPKDTPWQCLLRLVVPSQNKTITALGEGLNKSRAKHAAWLYICSKLHVSGELRSLYEGSARSPSESLPSESLPSEKLPSEKLPSENLPTGELPTGELPSERLPSGKLPSEKLRSENLPSENLPSENLPSENLAPRTEIKPEVMKEEADALIDIYSYAASYLLIPELKTMMTNLVTDMKRRGPGKTSKKSKHYHVTISLPEQNIQVSALATSSRMAEVAAALKFKKHAEKLHANASAESTMKQTVLTVETAKPFIDYYRSKRSWPYLEVGFNEVSQKLLRYDRVSFVAILSLGGKAVGKLVRMHSKKDAEKMAYLTAAVELAKGQPELLDDFAKQLETGTSLAPVKPVELSLDPGAVSIMRQSLWTIRNAGLPDERQTPQAEELDEDFRPRRLRSDITKEEIEARNKQLRSRLDAFNTSDKVAVLREQKAALPMNGYRKPVLEMISRSIYSIVVGATGSGKTTQVPQILLDDAINRNEGSQCNIICTQPRRIAATSVAQRVAVERGEMFQDTVGYHVRFENRRPVNAGSILYCTTGILLEQLKRSPDEVLDHASHLVIDEVHERDLQIDFLMVVLKKAVRERLQAGKPVPKIVLMSATLDTELFAKYFGEQTDGEIIPCPSISVPGRTFPVKEFYLDDLLKQLPAGVNQAFGDSSKFLDAEKRFAGSHSVGSDSTSATESAIDWKRDRSRIPGKLATEAEEAEEALVPLELTAAIILHICKTSKDGAILAFLPGLAELSKVDRLLKDNLMWQRIFGTDLPKMDVHLLHSTVPPEEQANVFKPPGTNIRKVILSTNIAETSVTIPDVKFVVDSGKLREKRYDQAKRISRLQTVWVSRSNSKQRAGRAGRVQNGTYYALFTKERFQSLRAIGLPELLRCDLQDTCLAIKAQAFKDSCSTFLSEAIEPPPEPAVESAVTSLKNLEAFTPDEELTPLGRLLSRLGIEPNLGKMVVLGVIFRCLDPMLILGAASATRDLFVSPLSKRSEAREAKLSYGMMQSDHLLILNAFQELRAIQHEGGSFAMKTRAEQKFIHHGTFRQIDDVCRHIVRILEEVGLVPPGQEEIQQQMKLLTGGARGQYNEMADLGYGSKDLNRNSQDWNLVKALLVAGHHPNLAVKLPSAVFFRTQGEASLMMASSSLNAVHKVKKAKDGEPPRMGNLYTFKQLHKGANDDQIWIHNSTLVSPLMAALFGGKLEIRRGGRLEMDQWLPITVNADNHDVAAKMLLEFRKALDRLLSNAFQSLSELRTKDRLSDFSSMADDPLIKTFSADLVDILELDANTVHNSRSKDSRPKDSRRGEREGRVGTLLDRQSGADSEGSLESTPVRYSFGRHHPDFEGSLESTPVRYSFGRHHPDFEGSLESTKSFYPRGPTHSDQVSQGWAGRVVVIRRPKPDDVEYIANTVHDTRPKNARTEEGEDRIGRLLDRRRDVDFEGSLEAMKNHYLGETRPNQGSRGPAGGSSVLERDEGLRRKPVGGADWDWFDHNSSRKDRV